VILVDEYLAIRVISGGHDLVDGDDEVGGARRTEPGATGMLGDEAADHRQPVQTVEELRHRALRLGERLLQAGGGAAVPEYRTRLTEAAFEHSGMAPVHLSDDLLVESGAIVGAEQPPGRRAGEGPVERRFMELTFDIAIVVVKVPDRDARCCEQTALEGLR
jgi:hypothetical protein